MNAHHPLPADVRIAAAAKMHAASAAPEESIGFVMAGQYKAQRNIAENPFASAQAHPDAVLGAQRDGLRALIHSHPHPHPPCPSLTDMRGQIAMQVPWAIVPVSRDREPGALVWWGPGVPAPGLLGRPYRHGVTDGYSLVRDWYGGRGIGLPDVARGWRGHNEREPDLYDRVFRGAGFELIDPAEAEVGDALLMRRNGDDIEHCAVLVEPGVILHHPGGDRPYDPTRLSRRDAAARWMPCVRRAIRYKNHD